MKREKLEAYLGRKVEITLFDGEVVRGVLHKTGEEQFKNEPNLYLPHNFYFCCTEPETILFRCSHVKKLEPILVYKSGR